MVQEMALYENENFGGTKFLKKKYSITLLFRLILGFCFLHSFFSFAHWQKQKKSNQAIIKIKPMASTYSANSMIYTSEMLAEAKAVAEQKEKQKQAAQVMIDRRRTLKKQLLEEMKNKPDGFHISSSLFQLCLTDTRLDIDSHFTWIATNLQAESIGLYATPSKPMKNAHKTTYYPQSLPDTIHVKKLSVAYDHQDPEKRLAHRTKRSQIGDLTEQILKIDEMVMNHQSKKVISNSDHEDDNIDSLIEVLQFQQKEMRSQVQTLQDEMDD